MLGPSEVQITPQQVKHLIFMRKYGMIGSDPIF